MQRSSVVQKSMYWGEHWLAWLMSIGAIALGIVGWLRAVDVIHGTGVSDLGGSGDFWDGMLFFVPALSAAILAMTLHSSEHHRLQPAEVVRGRERLLLMTEHSLAWIMATATIALSAVGMVVGLNVFATSFHQSDGLIWVIPGLAAAALTGTLHAVSHHQVESEEEYMVRVVEERISTTRPPGGVAPTSGIQSGR